MRNAMICVSVMLAIILVWPLMFMRGGSEATNVAARAIKPAVAKSADTSARTIQVGLSMLIPPAVAKPESCERHLARAERKCGSDNACLLAASDKWDLCQATGAWQD